MRITVMDGMSAEAVRILMEAGHEPLPWTDFKQASVWWTRLSKVETTRPGDIVATPCTGTDHVKAPRVLCLRDCGDISQLRGTVEHTIGLILALTRRIPSAVESVRRGEWDRMRFQGTDLDGKTALVVGYGRIGSAVDAILQLLGLHTFIWERLYSMPGFLGAADLITVHVSLNETSRGMFGREQFAAMKPGALFINTSRGAVVDEAALLEALESGHLGGAALDVLCEEPPKPDNPLLEFARREPERLLISPHLGGCTRESLEKAEVLLAKRLVQELEKC